MSFDVPRLFSEIVVRPAGWHSRRFALHSFRDFATYTVSTLERGRECAVLVEQSWLLPAREPIVRLLG